MNRKVVEAMPAKYVSTITGKCETKSHTSNGGDT